MSFCSNKRKQEFPLGWYECKLDSALKKTFFIHQLKLCLSFFFVNQDRRGDVMANEVADYDGIVVRLRGDGRTYTLNVQTKGIRDDDIHQSFFHTRGGPYWEIVRVR